ncbi:MAG: hypothetical protein AAB943_00115 [Patescibacteria group bacterium]
MEIKRNFSRDISKKYDITSSLEVAENYFKTIELVFSLGVFDNERYSNQDQTKISSEVKRVLKRGGYYIGFSRDNPSGLEVVSQNTPNFLRKL